MASQVDKNYKEEIEKAKKDLETLISSKKCNAIDLLRFAYASQFTIAKSGAERTDKKHLETIAKIRTDHLTITYPDLYQLAGTVAVKELGGPEIKFSPRRKDSLTPPDESCLPDLTQSPKDLKDFFRKVNISDPKHILALYGGLKLATAEDKGGDLKFDNKYFLDLVKGKDLSPSDKALSEDKDFISFVNRYANNKEEFFKDYVEAHKKLYEIEDKQTLIATTSKPEQCKKSQIMQNLIATTPMAVGVGVAAAVVILSIFYLIHKKRTQHPSQQFP